MRSTSEKPLAALSHELKGAHFGNQHLTKRFLKMVEAAMDRPSDSFPEMFNTEANLEGAYRFLRNPNVTWRKAMAPHFAATLKRAKSHRKILVIHDTTDCVFGGEKRREGLGYLSDSDKVQGFRAHFAFALAHTDDRVPLGAIGLEILCREGTPKRNPSYKSCRDPNRESLRWARLVAEVEERIGGSTQAIHIMDREADGYELLDKMIGEGKSFVIRLCYNRALAEPAGYYIEDALDGIEGVCEREVFLSHRGPGRRGTKDRKIHPPRQSRIARLRFSAAAVEIKRPNHVLAKHSKSLAVNVVKVEEIDPPDEVDKVEWRLLTTLPIQTTEQILEIVDIYRARWSIEEFFKVLKTGCNYEKRQLESTHTLLNALSLFVPVVHRLLLLRHLSRTAPKSIASTVLTKTQLRILASLPDTKLPQHPTARDALLEIARLGGHIRNNGDPGWIVLWRGYQKLMMYEVAWRAKK